MSQVRFVPSSECPHEMKGLEQYKKNSTLLCCVLLSPSDKTDAIVKSLINEYGSISKSYYNANPSLQSKKYLGTGKGDAKIKSHISPYTQDLDSSKHCIGIFYHSDDKKFLESKFKEVFKTESTAKSSQSP